MTSGLALGILGMMNLGVSVSKAVGGSAPWCMGDPTPPVALGSRTYWLLCYISDHTHLQEAPRSSERAADLGLKNHNLRSDSDLALLCASLSELCNFKFLS